MKKFKYILSGFLASALLFTGCTSDFNEINTDPDSASEVPPTNVLAYVLRYTSGMYGGTYCIQGPGAYGGQTAEIQYISQSRYESFGYVTYMFDYSYYYMLNNLADVISMTEESGNTNLNAVAKIWKCYIFHTMTDQLGAIPYKEALQGKENLKPAYDTPEEIYQDIFNVLDECNTALTNGTGAIGEGDLFYSGNTLKWRKFANSLRLRMAMRVSKSSMASTAQGIVSTMLANPDKYPLCTTNDDNCMMNWSGTNGYYEPWYNNSLTRDDYAISNIIVDQLFQLNDPRLATYASPITSTDESEIARAYVYEGKRYRGAPIGPLTQENLFGVSRMGKRFRDTPDGFTPHLRSSEVWLNIAEAAALGWTTAYDAKSAYDKGITCSMEENGIAEDKIEAYLNGKGKFDGTLNCIYTQLWLSVYKDGNEAWAIYRKTGIPAAHTIAEGTKYPDHNTTPFTLPYPTTEYDYNYNNVVKYQENQSTGDYFWAKRLFWDTRENVY